MLRLFKQINYVLSKKDKIRLLFVFITILGSAALDLVGVSAILPVVSLLTTGESAIDDNTILSIASSIFKTRNPDSLAIILLVCLCGFFVVKSMYMVLHTYVLNKFTLSTSRKLTKRLMESYLSFPYEFHLNNNSSTLIRKSTYDVTYFTETLTSILSFVTKLSTTTVIVIYLFITDYRITLVVGGVLFVFSTFVLLFLKPKVKKIAKKAQKLNSHNYKFLSQAFNGIKESKISNTESFFTSVYDENRGKINKLSLKKRVLDSIPTHFIELFGIVGICLSLIIIIAVGKDDAAKIINIFAVFAYAILKLLPSVTTITSTLNNLNFYKVSVDSLFEDLKLSENSKYVEKLQTNVVPLPFEKEIEVKNLSFYYESASEKLILNNVSLKIEKNSSVAFSGASGAGKTTLVDIILGLLPPRKGNIFSDGYDISKNIRGWRTNISYIPQTIYLSDDTIKNNIAFGIKQSDINDEKIWAALEKAQLKEYVEGLPEGLNTVIGERGIRMSGGQRQRMGIARAFYRDTNIIVFDEATSALDFETEKNILDHVSQYAKDHTLIIITHRLNTIESCDCIYNVKDGNVIQIK